VDHVDQQDMMIQKYLWTYQDDHHVDNVDVTTNDKEEVLNDEGWTKGMNKRKWEFTSFYDTEKRMKTKFSDY
jgi:hypothetical protein